MAQQKKAKGAKGSNIKASAPKSSKTAAAAKENSHLYEIIAIIAIMIITKNIAGIIISLIILIKFLRLI